MVYVEKETKYMQDETSNSLTRTQLTVFKNWLPRNFKLVLLTHENIECSSLQLSIICYENIPCIPPLPTFCCIIRIVLHYVFKRSLRTTIHWQEQIALQCIGYFMPSTNHSHACKKFVPQRALAYTLSETYVGREKIDPYLQILYYISNLAKK